ncbi:MAG: hypothetical protein EOO71_00545 [Myxococcaceae bacterium]|nr:MAG: hypothetical protein EOO71_00545 [Myxococcaceae bacterium]
MNDASTGASRQQRFFQGLRGSLLGFTGAMTLGIAVGCGSGSDEAPVCDTGCLLAGTYALTFTQPEPLPSGCGEAGLSLPTGPLVVTRQSGGAGILNATLPELPLQGTYTEDAGLRMLLNGEGTSRTGFRYAVLLDARFASASSGPTVVSTDFQGVYKLFLLDGDGSACTVTRELMGRRQ